RAWDLGSSDFWRRAATSASSATFRGCPHSASAKEWEKMTGAARLEDPERSPEHRLLVVAQVDHAVGKDDGDAAVCDGKVLDRTEPELQVLGAAFSVLGVPR